MGTLSSKWYQLKKCLHLYRRSGQMNYKGNDYGDRECKNGIIFSLFLVFFFRSPHVEINLKNQNSIIFKIYI